MLGHVTIGIFQHNIHFSSRIIKTSITLYSCKWENTQINTTSPAIKNYLLDSSLQQDKPRQERGDSGGTAQTRKWGALRCARFPFDIRSRFIHCVDRVTWSLSDGFWNAYWWPWGNNRVGSVFFWVMCAEWPPLGLCYVVSWMFRLFVRR